MISITHDSDLEKTTIVLRGDLTIVFEYSSLPPQWRSKPVAYEQEILDSLNAQIEQRKDFTTWYADKDYKTDDVEYKIDPNQENLYKDPATDEMVYVDHIITAATWNEKRGEYLLSIKRAGAGVKS